MNRRYVDIPRPHQLSPGRFQADLYFPASAAKRARQQHAVARELARIYDVEATTPVKDSARWSAGEATGASRERSDRLDHRRLTVQGKPRSLARYLAALRRVLTAVERLATRAARAFGSWRRSLLTVLSGQLDDETPATLRARAAGFRAEVLTTLVGYLACGPHQPARRNPTRPLWEQADAMAFEVWQQVGGIDPWTVTPQEIDAELQRMLHTDLSIVEQPDAVDAPEPQLTMPDTVDELLKRSGPAEQAPIEDDFLPQQIAVSAHGPALVTAGVRSTGESGRVSAGSGASVAGAWRCKGDWRRGRGPSAPAASSSTPPVAGARSRRAARLAGAATR